MSDINGNATITPQAQPVMPSMNGGQMLVSKSTVQPGVVYGGANPRLVDGAGADAGENRIDVVVAGNTRIFRMGYSGRYNNRTQIQAQAGVTVQITVSAPSDVDADIASVAVGGAANRSLWTTVTLSNGYAEIQGSVSGIMFTGNGRAIASKQ